MLFRQPTITQEQHRARRTRFLAQLAPNSVAVMVSNPEATRSNDSEYKYRQSSDILYLTGFPEPECVVVLTNIKDEPPFTMLVRPRNKKLETWTGKREGPQGARQHYGADRADATEHFQKVLGFLLPKASQVYYQYGRNQAMDSIFHKAWTSRGQKPLANPETILHEMRLFKSQEEVDCMQYASDVSAYAHVMAMRACSANLKENQLQAVIESIFTFNGADAPAYNSIVGGGKNATTLHYESNNCQLHNGDLVLVDAACEYQGYASDITRTFPVNGKFTRPQREIYETVLDAQLTAIKCCHPGVTLVEVHKIAKGVLERHLVRLGILPKPGKRGQKPSGLSIDDFFMHGTSHWIGLDVHDVGNRNIPGSSPQQPRPVRPGMAFTVEPGLYFDSHDKRVPKQYRGIGVRIEDDILITPDGYIVLTSKVPKTVKGIEALMASGDSTMPLDFDAPLSTEEILDSLLGSTEPQV